MAKKKEEKAAVEQPAIEKVVETVNADDKRNYTIVVEALFKNGEETSVQTINIFAENPAEAFSWMLNLKDLYNQPGILKVKLLGAYKRTALRVVDGN